MFFVIPLQVEEAAVDRLPLVSIGIAVACAVVFLGTWVLPADSRAVEDDFQTLTDYYAEHPYLELPEDFSSRLLSDHSREALEVLHHKAEGKRVAGGEAQRGKEQAYVDELAARILEEIDATPMRRWALVPARGLHQPGWITHLFLHYGWMHLLGNLLFFYIAAPLLEDVWGRLFFGAFYLLGGVLAGAAQVLIEHGSAVGIAGASGAIAACMGAFTYRYAGRRVRMGYLIWFIRIFRGTFLLPAWLWGLSWFGMEVFSFARGTGHSGVAVMAHIAGFLFGGAVAFGIGISGFERRTLKPAVERGVVFRADPLGSAHEALEGADFTTASIEFRKRLVERPDDREALLGLIQTDFALNKHGAGMVRLERLLSQLLREGKSADAWESIAKVSARVDARRFSPRMAKMLIDASEYAPAALFLSMANTLKDLTSREVPAPAAPVPAPVPAPAVVAATEAVRVVGCRLLAVTAETVEVETLAGQRRVLPLARLAGVGAGTVPLQNGGGTMILTDLVLRFAGPTGPATVARFTGPNLQLGRIFPGVPPRDGHRKLLSLLLAMPQMVALPGREEFSKGAYPAFSDEAAMDAAFYGAPDQAHLA
jgi:membrane associated rhomboid family serine protease